MKVFNFDDVELMYIFVIVALAFIVIYQTQGYEDLPLCLLLRVLWL